MCARLYSNNFSTDGLLHLAMSTMPLNCLSEYFIPPHRGPMPNRVPPCFPHWLPECPIKHQSTNTQQCLQESHVLSRVPLLATLPQPESPVPTRTQHSRSVARYIPQHISLQLRRTARQDAPLPTRAYHSLYAPLPTRAHYSLYVPLTAQVPHCIPERTIHQVWPNVRQFNLRPARN